MKVKTSDFDFGRQGELYDILEKSVKTAQDIFLQQEGLEFTQVLKQVLAEEFEDPDTAYTELIDYINRTVDATSREEGYSNPYGVLEVFDDSGCQVVEGKFYREMMSPGEDFVKHTISSAMGIDMRTASAFYNEEGLITDGVYSYLEGVSRKLQEQGIYFDFSIDATTGNIKIEYVKDPTLSAEYFLNKMKDRPESVAIKVEGKDFYVEKRHDMSFSIYKDGEEIINNTEMSFGIDLKRLVENSEVSQVSKDTLKLTVDLRLKDLFAGGYVFPVELETKEINSYGIVLPDDYTFDVIKNRLKEEPGLSP